jgi:8-oxo-dGTP pyrophosphatase MutT (NUDIX family)
MLAHPAGAGQATKDRSIAGRKTNMIRELSAGAVVLRRMKNQWWVAVIEPGREGEPEDRKHVIALPKGNIDPGEKPLETAVREVREETGLRAGPITKLGDIKYVYQRKWSDSAKVFKIVSFFLMKHLSGHIGDIKPNMKHEVRRAYWLPLDRAAGSLSYSGEKQMAKKALEYAKAHPQGLVASPKSEA